MEMKKLLSILLTVMLLLSVCPVGPFSITASAATSGTTGDCTWTLDNGILTISGNGGMDNYRYNEGVPWGSSFTEIIINEGVTSIGDYAFQFLEGLTNVTIPYSVTSIGSCAFMIFSPDKNFLTSITIHDSVTSIGGSAFYGLESLEEVNIPDLAAWCDIAFGNYSANPLYYAKNLCINGVLATDITIPDTVKSIKGYTFCNCSSLTSLTIPDSVTSIGDYAFYGCTGLTSITIPNSVTSIGSSAFEGCTGLTSITIPNSVTSIGNSAFEGCTGLTSITIPNSVTSIGSSAFEGCTVMIQ